MSIAVRLHAGPVTSFRPVTEADAVVQVTMALDEQGNYDFRLDTNIGRGMPSKAVLAAVSHGLYLLAHALVEGEAVDLTDLDGPIPPAAPGFDGSHAQPREGV